MVKYILISAAKNEEKYIERTILTVIQQTIQPSIWLIIDDNSTDGTEIIIQQYAKNHSFIQYQKLTSNTKERNFQSKVYALNHALAYLGNLNYEYDFIGIIDIDIELPRDYYERISNNMLTNQQLGIAGGWIVEECNGIFTPRIGNRINYVPGAIQLYRRECFKQIGQFYPLPYGGEDSLMVFVARMNKWEIAAFDEIPVKHLRPTGYSQGLKGRFKYGKTDQSLGFPIIFIVFKGISRLFYKPFGGGTLSYWIGYFLAYFERKKSYTIPDNVRHYIHDYCLQEVKNKLYNNVKVIHRDSY